MKTFLSTSVRTSCDATNFITSTSTTANSSFSMSQTEVVHLSSINKREDSPLCTGNSLRGCDKEQLERDTTINRISTVASSMTKRRRITNAATPKATSSIQNYFTPLASKACSEVSIDITPTSTEPVEETQQYKRRKVEEELVSDDNTSEDKQSNQAVGAASCPVCGAMVSGCMAEHLDYHTAMDLHESFQNSTSFNDKRSTHKETHHRQLPSQEKIQMFFKRT